MEDIITQKFSYATITVFKDYCKIADKKKSLNSMSVNLDDFDGDEDEVFENRKQQMRFILEDLRRKPSVGRIVEFPEKLGNKKTRFFYGSPNVNERTSIDYAINKFETRNDRHIKRHYGNPFSEISVNTIERSIRRHGDKVTIKVYRHIRYRSFNSIYFKQSSSVESVTFNLVTGNFTTLSMNKTGKKTTKTFRTNSLTMLEVQFGPGGIIDMRKLLDDKSDLINDYKETFNNSDFVSALDRIFKLNQNIIFNGKWFSHLMLERFVQVKQIKVSNDYTMWVKNYYPTEKFLKKNERKLVASILDMFQIKSKITIKIMHSNGKLDIHSLAQLCYLFGDNYSKYIASIDIKHFMNSTIEPIGNMGCSKFMYADENKKHGFDIRNNEKENIVKILNNLECQHRGYFRLTSEKETLVNQRFIGDLIDHFKMISKLRQYIPDLHLKAKNIDEFNKEHSELSKMVSLIKKGWVIEYVFVDKMVEDVEKPIDVKIDLDTDKVGEITFYPHILKREDEYKEEGDFMHHCVASYSDKEKSIIVSIRTENQQDRVTCEFDCQTGRLIQARHFCNGQAPGDMELAVKQLETKTKYYARMGLLHSLEKRKSPVKINGKEVLQEHKEPKRYNIFNEPIPF